MVSLSQLPKIRANAIDDVDRLLRSSLVTPLRIASFSLEADPLYPEGYGGKRGIKEREKTS